MPARNAASHLAASIPAAHAALRGRGECIVVDDGSTDGTAEVARRLGCRVVATRRRVGAAAARNQGARASEAEILLFVDADCCAHPDVVDRVWAAFDADSTLDAVFGAYDTDPPGGVVTQFRTLLHAYTHRIAQRDAATFWTGCGAIRRRTFEAVGGFDESQASMEDIELGMRVTRAGGVIRVDPRIQVRHLKRWPIGRLIAADIFDRAVPWTQLILRDGGMRNDLNLRVSQRASVVLAVLALAALPLSAVNVKWLAVEPVAWTAIIALNAGFYRFLADVRSVGWAARCVPLHVLHFGCAAAGFAIALVQEPVRAAREFSPARVVDRPKS